MEKITWTENRIREEISKLDEMTGLEGAKLPIEMIKAHSAQGCFKKHRNGWMGFGFSIYHFMDPNYAVQEAIDTIRHEYAHFMDYVLYGNFGHGATWKECCNKIGARPIRCSDESLNKYYNEKNEEERIQNEALDTFKVQDVIIHPKYGKGTIIDITDEALSRKAVVKFLTGEKTLSLLWISNNCKREHII